MKPNPLTQLSAELHSLARHSLARRVPVKLPTQFPARLPARLAAKLPIKLSIRLPVAIQRRLQRWSRHLVSQRNGLLVGVGLLLLWVWLWQWLLSIAIGLAVTAGIYLAQQGQLRWPRTYWRRLWKPTNRSLTLSCLAGGLALAYTYLATAVWLESDQHWLVTSILLEGLGIVAIGGWLLWRWQTSVQEAGSTQAEVGQSWLLALSHPDPLQRLIAVRQLTRQASAAQSPLMTATELADCFRLMLDREPEVVVRQALIESLQMLSPTRQLEATSLSTADLAQVPRSIEQADPAASPSVKATVVDPESAARQIRPTAHLEN